MTILEASKQLYEKFCSETMGTRAMLSWEELPQMVRDAWVNTLTRARDMEVPDLFDVRSDDGEFVGEIPLQRNRLGFPPRKIVVDGVYCDRKKVDNTYVYYMRKQNG